MFQGDYKLIRFNSLHIRREIWRQSLKTIRLLFLIVAKGSLITQLLFCVICRTRILFVVERSLGQKLDCTIFGPQSFQRIVGIFNFK